MVSVVGVVIAVTSLRTIEIFKYSSLKPSEQELKPRLDRLDKGLRMLLEWRLLNECSLKDLEAT